MVNLSAYQFADLPVFLYLLTQVSPPESVTCIIQLLIEHFYLIIFVHFYINIYNYGLEYHLQLKKIDFYQAIYWLISIFNFVNGCSDMLDAAYEYEPDMRSEYL